MYSSYVIHNPKRQLVGDKSNESSELYELEDLTNELKSG